ncbi:MAG: O-antigen ligase family protein [Vulcanibacillus sp.]
MRIRTNIFKEIKEEQLLLIAIIFSPFTQLRYGFIGISELAFILFILKIAFSRNIKINIKNRSDFLFSKFWLLFFIFSLIGLFYNYIVMKHVSGMLSSMIFDLFSYVLIFLLCIAMEIYIVNFKEVDIKKLLYRVYLYISIIMLILFGTSRFTSNLFGYTLLYYHYFSPFANNIHQVSMVMAPLPFLGLKVLIEEKKTVNKIFHLLLIISNIYIAIETGSLKIAIGFLVGAIFIIYFLMYNRNKHRLEKLLFILSFSAVLSIVIYYNYEYIAKNIMEFFISEDSGAGRQILWEYSFEKIMHSPIVGYGPGSHALYYWDYNDAHSTLITVALQGGLLALAFYILLNIKLFISLFKEQYLLGAFMSILVYAIGGDVMRRIPIWVYLVLLYYNNVKNKKSQAF